MADGLNAMTVGVQHKSAVVVGVILGRPNNFDRMVGPLRVRSN